MVRKDRGVRDFDGVLFGSEPMPDSEDSVRFENSNGKAPSS